MRYGVLIDTHGKDDIVDRVNSVAAAPGKVAIRGIGTKWTTDEEKNLWTHYQQTDSKGKKLFTYETLGQLLGRTAKQVDNKLMILNKKAINNTLKFDESDCEIDTDKSKESSLKKVICKITEEHINALKKNYHKYPISQLNEKVDALKNLTMKQIKDEAKRLQLTETKPKSNKQMKATLSAQQHSKHTNRFYIKRGVEIKSLSILLRYQQDDNISDENLALKKIKTLKFAQLMKGEPITLFIDKSELGFFYVNIPQSSLKIKENELMNII